MIDIEQTLQRYQESLCPKIELGGLFARSDIAHKWKFTFLLISLREGISWRIVDILIQAYRIGCKGMTVGARILTRSALETVCLLIYMNRRMQAVVENKMSLNDFQLLTNRMFFGAKNQKEKPSPINVKRLVKESEKKYQGLEKIFDDLCETAHPNYGGICEGYIKFNRKEYETEFGIYWEERYGSQHEAAIRICIEIFEEEYNNEWGKWFEALEKWLENNDNKLERQRRKKLKRKNT